MAGAGPLGNKLVEILRGLTGEKERKFPRYRRAILAMGWLLCLEYLYKRIYRIYG